jgi:hypothetical protein
LSFAAKCAERLYPSDNEQSDRGSLSVLLIRIAFSHWIAAKPLIKVSSIPARLAFILPRKLHFPHFFERELMNETELFFVHRLLPVRFVNALNVGASSKRRSLTFTADPAS